MDRKYWTGIAGVALMGFSSLFPAAYPECMTLWYWRVIIVVVFVLGVACMLWQGYILTRADRRTDEKLDKISEVFARLAPPVRQEIAPAQVNDSLSMRILRSTLLPQSWARPLLDDLVYRSQGKPLPKVDFDYICELNIVNRADPPITLEKFAAKVKVAGREWEIATPVLELRAYQTKKMDDIFSRKDLPNLLEKVSGIPLANGIGYRGFVAFRFQATTDEVCNPVQVELFATDAAGRRHETTVLAEPEHFDDEVTYSVKSLRAE